MDFHKTLYASDLVITTFSTATLEAMILDKPVLTVNFTKGFNPMPYANSDATIQIYNESDFEEKITKTLYDDQEKKKQEEVRKQLIYDFAYLQDGKATERIVDIITQTIHQIKEKCQYEQQLEISNK